MQRYLPLKSASLLGFFLLLASGCGVWPIMTDDQGRRPQAMGKDDQVLWPWAPQPIHLNEEYGIPYRQALEGQIANPEASRNLDPVYGGIDPDVAQSQYSRYQLMFDSPPYSTLKLGSKSKSGSSAPSAPPPSSGGSTGDDSQTGLGGGMSK